MAIDRKNVYKLPWSTTDNQGGWVEVTDRCDLLCPGCYRKSMEGDRSLEIVKQDILECQRITNCDAMVIAGGEPLIYPDITEVVGFIAQNGMKPLILSNGTNFTEKLARELKSAGLKRIHFHVDSRQDREGWQGKNEMELNTLRDYYTGMVSGLKNVQCGFHIVVSHENLDQIPAIIEWYRNNMHRVHHLSLIAFRGIPKPDGYDYIAGNTIIDPKLLENFFSNQQAAEISTGDMFEVLQQYYPDYFPAAYINGSAFPETNKYLIFVNIGSRKMFYGGFGAKSMELSQVFSHLFRGKYISFGLQPAVGKKVFLLSLFDRQVGKAFSKFLKVCISSPRYLLRKVYIQSLILQQPIEFIGGKRNNCDPCINPLMYRDKAINPCQLDEYRTFGGILNSIKL
jgi:organic radical activating enzyme